MIKKKKGICKNCSREEYIIGIGLCLRCHTKQKNIEKLAKLKDTPQARHSASKPLSRSKGKIVPLRTQSRLKQEIQYKKVCDEIDNEKRLAKAFNCFFCGEPINGSREHHHLQGRTGANLVNKKYIVLSHHQCHFDYHNISVKKIKWFLGFIDRVREIDGMLAYKQLLKLNK